AGALLALRLARRGIPVRLSERRPDPRTSAPERGRSINLALASRGIRALESAGVMDRIRPLLIPMRGRMIHELGAQPALLPYGQRADEVIYSVDRAALNRVLIEEADRYSEVTLEFGRSCLGVVPERDALRFRDTAAREYELALGPTIATDGAGSAIRNSLVAAGHVRVREDWLDHDYKELTIPPIDGRPAIDPNALHVWPRVGFMLIALPNTDATFTATLFLARSGPRSFDCLGHPEAVRQFFAEEFPDAVALLPNLTREFDAHPTGQLATVHAAPWRVGGQVLLLGDAAHAIVPFHGQGMNAAFEDCALLDTLLDSHGDWESLFAAFERARRADAEAIARMAVENYSEMRAAVLDPGFVRRRALALELERHFPDRFIPRYSMIMFHPEIPYGEALRRGTIQERILLELDQAAAGMAAPVDLPHATALINARLPELARA
ncbi:MAG TPA: NAD(P)/FAD-dependent oxidoreductase, partial [Steroidobacteraceae bacterium]|nr:NAD(P)/FAD-dependent oxidoreductase [Steroidobacteraceae bacterium]